MLSVLSLSNRLSMLRDATDKTQLMERREVTKQ